MGWVQSAYRALCSPQKGITYDNYPPFFLSRGSRNTWGWLTCPGTPLDGASSSPTYSVAGPSHSRALYQWTLWFQSELFWERTEEHLVFAFPFIFLDGFSQVAGISSAFLMAFGRWNPSAVQLVRELAASLCIQKATSMNNPCIKSTNWIVVIAESNFRYCEEILLSTRKGRWKDGFQEHRSNYLSMCNKRVKKLLFTKYLIYFSVQRKWASKAHGDAERPKGCVYCPIDNFVSHFC